MMLHYTLCVKLILKQFFQLGKNFFQFFDPENNRFREKLYVGNTVFYHGKLIHNPDSTTLWLTIGSGAKDNGII